MNNNSQPGLHGLNVLLTRPEHKADALAGMLQARGARAVQLPLLQINPIGEDSSVDHKAFQDLKSRILKLDQYDLALFVSTSAATLGMQWIDRYWPQLPAGLAACSVGPGTASVLRGFDWPVYFPEDGVTSEHLLALPALQNMAGKRVALFRGQGGRELLAQTLREQGAEVDYIELYRRSVPSYEKGHVARTIRNEAINLIVISSMQSLEVLLCALSRHTSDQAEASGFTSIPLVVPAARVRDRAVEAGDFELVLDANGADDDSVLNCINHYVTGRRSVRPV